MKKKMSKQRDTDRTDWIVILHLKDRSYLVAKFLWREQAEQYVQSRHKPEHYTIEPNQKAI